ncbi:MAG: alpha/beta fold hydrolase [Desulfitobacterium sp.]
MEEVFKSEAGKQEILGKYREMLDAWPVQNRQYEVATSSGPTFVIESGVSENPPLILLHGSMSNSLTWYGDVVTLSKTHHVFAVDMIGEPGLSAPSRPSYESGAYPLWLNEIFLALGLKSSAIVGLSLGGWMALSFASQYPEKVEQLVLLCPGGIAPVSSGLLWKFLFFSLFGKWGEQQILKMLTGGKVPLEVSPGMEEGLAFTMLINKHFKPRTAKLPIYTDEALSKLSMPILIICGEYDQLIPAKKSISRLKQLAPQTESVLLPNTGHVVINQAERILDFLTPHTKIVS